MILKLSLREEMEIWLSSRKYIHHKRMSIIKDLVMRLLTDAAEFVEPLLEKLQPAHTDERDRNRKWRSREQDTTRSEVALSLRSNATIYRLAFFLLVARGAKSGVPANRDRYSAASAIGRQAGQPVDRRQNAFSVGWNAVRNRIPFQACVRRSRRSIYENGSTTWLSKSYRTTLPRKMPEKCGVLTSQCGVLKGSRGNLKSVRVRKLIPHSVSWGKMSAL